MRIADKIAAAVLDLARKHEATRVESYPVRPFHEPRIYRGTEGLYRRMGFVEAGFEHDGEHQILLMTKTI